MQPLRVCRWLQTWLSGGRRLAVPDDSLDSDQGWAEWAERWGSMPHHQVTLADLSVLGKDLIEAWGQPVGATIVLAPPEFAGRLWTKTPVCPICGRTTKKAMRDLALLHATFATSRGLGFGVWVHPACFAGCPATDQPAPIPW